MNSHQYRRKLLPLLALTAATATLFGCASQASPAAKPSSSSTQSAAGSEKEVASLTPRALVAHKGGLSLIDTATGDVVLNEKLEGFLRLSPAGDGQHVFVTDSDVFRVFGTGLKAVEHGDHNHYYQSTPAMTATTFEAPHAGHVVVHAGYTTLFADGTGAIQIMKTADVASGKNIDTRSAGAAHHGVALLTADGTLLTTQGTKEARKTVSALQGDKVVATTDNCPGVHGEAAAAPNSAGDVVVFGCENGPVIYKDNAFAKVAVADAYARTGNLAGHDKSSVVLGDYKVDAKAKHEHPTRISLIDTTNNTLKLVDLGSEYWFRSLARGGEGEALVLTADGSLRVIDPATGAQKAKVDVIAPWTEPDDWQQPGPVLKAEGAFAYVLDPAANELVTIKLADASVVSRVAVPAGAVELAITTGKGSH